MPALVPITSAEFASIIRGEDKMLEHIKTYTRSIVDFVLDNPTLTKEELYAKLGSSLQKTQTMTRDVSTKMTADECKSYVAARLNKTITAHERLMIIAAKLQYLELTKQPMTFE